ncbi:superinfection immunity protein [Hymenobacter sediminicola]|uniref:Superinfection immunity protein n=1 Tax=Hymenobacter sediminicola TaxID=2761579 RepID=A0A7G7W2X1_9BACT|nr:superinfection immunity protein [Hymenobacter sediminicola]QNH60714.1 superinfection immunity protein [Hymenobacter sediminicola]
MVASLLLDAYSTGYSLGQILGAILILGLYFLPSYIGRKKRQFTGIVLLNLLLGWTGLGWIAALIWAASPDKQGAVTASMFQPVPSMVPVNSVADEINKLRSLRDAGELTNEEFLQQKSRLLRGA